LPDETPIDYAVAYERQKILPHRVILGVFIDVVSRLTCENAIISL
jgi:hypothetical protein